MKMISRCRPTRADTTPQAMLNFSQRNLKKTSQTRVM
jgi:hypothetical protein